MLKSFKSSKALIIQLSDLSLHKIEIPSGDLKWTREESLSNIKQVEVITQDQTRIESELEYVRNVKAKAPLESIPTRIANRYKENFQYLVNHLKSMGDQLSSKGSTAIKDNLSSQFGFRKVFLMLTDVGKLVAVSSIDGAVKWTEYLHGQTSKIIVRNMMDKEIEEKGEFT